MSCNLNLQRNTKIFYSTVDLASGDPVGDMVPANTHQVEVLSGYAVSQDAATQDITTLESGLTPDRSVTRFNTAINPVEWNFQCYLKPTGIDDIDSGGDGISFSSNVKPLADWFMWQAALSNTAPADGTEEQSAWENEGVFRSVSRGTTANVAAHNPNFAVAQENHLYIVMDNVYYQVSNAAVNEASVDATIDGIATTTWTGFGTNLIELREDDRNNAVSVFGGVLNDGTEVAANGNAYAVTAVASYQPWNSYNVSSSITSASFIKNRLTTLNAFHTPEGSSAVNYTFPVTAMSWTLNNNITYLTPEELATLNSPIGNFAGSRSINGTFSAYLRHGGEQSATFLRNIVEDSRVSHSSGANANLQIGGTNAPFVAFYHPAVQYDFPTHAVEDVISVSASFQAQETTENCGNGDEVTIFVKKS